MICDYGCGQEGKYQLKNGKQCCHESQNTCPEMRKKNSNTHEGQIPWNKDIPHTEKTKRKIGKKSKRWWETTPEKQIQERNRKISESHKGENNPSKRPEVRKKISEAKKGIYIGENNPMYGKYHTEETRRKMSEAKKGIYIGENHPNWKGGIGKLPYAPDWGPKVKRKVFERDGFECRNPDCWGEDESPIPHHIDYDKMNCDSTNLITLCVSCNGRANSNRSYWQKIYENKIKENFAIKKIDGVK